MSRQKDLDDISFIVIEFPKRKKNLISLCIRRAYNMRSIEKEESKGGLWKETDIWHVYYDLNMEDIKSTKNWLMHVYEKLIEQL